MDEMTRSELLKKYLSVTANLNSVKNHQKDVHPVRSDYPYSRGETVPGASSNIPNYHSSFSRNSRVQSPSGRVEGRASADIGKRYRRGERVDNYNDNNNNNNNNNDNNNNSNCNDNNNNNNSNNNLFKDSHINKSNNSNNINYSNNNNCDVSQHYNAGEGSAFISAQKWLNEWNKKTKKEDINRNKTKIEINSKCKEKYEGYDKKEKEEGKEEEKVRKVPSGIRGTRYRSSDSINADPRSPGMKSENVDPKSDINNQTDYLRTLRVGKLISELPAMCVGDLRRLMFVR